MEAAADLSAQALAEALPGRAARTYPAMLSTQADALAWARSGAPAGALVVADFQASPRGRSGWPWEVRPGVGLGFSVVLRPKLSAEREGWPYVVATCALADVLGDAARIAWPDEVRVDERRAAAVGVDVQVGDDGVEWAVVNVLVVDATPPRAPLLARAVEGIEARARTPAATVLADYLPRCATIGRRVTARLAPMRPGGPHVTGEAVRVVGDGALVIRTDEGRRAGVPPASLGVLEGA